MQPGAYQGLKVLFYALLVGQLLFAGIATFLIITKGAMSKTTGLENSLLPIAIIGALACAMFGMKIFKTRVELDAIA